MGYLLVHCIRVSHCPVSTAGFFSHTARVRHRIFIRFKAIPVRGIVHTAALPLQMNQVKNI